GLVLVLCATAAVAAGTDRERARRAGEHRSGCRRARVRQARAAGRTCRAAGEIAWGPVERQRSRRCRRTPMADRSVRLWRSSRGGSGDAAPVRCALRASVRKLQLSLIPSSLCLLVIVLAARLVLNRQLRREKRDVPLAADGRIGRYASLHDRAASPAVSARPCGHRPPLPASADARGGLAGAGLLAASAHARVRPVRRGYLPRGSA